jgi:DNA-binding MurR/RpiR family transcriptional regulator
MSPAEINKLNHRPRQADRPGIEQRLRLILGSGSSSQRRLAEFILRNPIRVAAASIEDLGRIVGVSAPTISRFARELDFAGFAEMRAAVAEATQEVLDPVTRLTDRLKVAPGRHQALESFDTLRRQLAVIDMEELGLSAERISARIAAAGTVYVMGFGMSSHVAALLVMGLLPYHGSVVTVVEYGGTEVAALRLANITSADLLIAITVPRYTKEGAYLADLAKSRGAGVIVLTDSAASPLREYADELLLLPCKHPVLPSSMTIFLAAIEMIVTAVMLSDPANAEKARRFAEVVSVHLRREK